MNGVTQSASEPVFGRRQQATALGDSARLRKELAVQGRVVLGLDGLRPDVGHEVLWVLRDCLYGQVLLARSLLSSTCEDLVQLLRQALQPLGKIPVVGVISDGQDTIRRAVAQELPGVPHQLCQFHFLREAALPVFEADLHAKKLLKTQVSGVRPIERSVEGRDDTEAMVVRGYCSAVRSTLTDDGHPPLDADGLRLKQRLEAVSQSVQRVAQKGAAVPGTADEVAGIA